MKKKAIKTYWIPFFNKSRGEIVWKKCQTDDEKRSPKHTVLEDPKYHYFTFNTKGKTTIDNVMLYGLEGYYVNNPKQMVVSSVRMNEEALHGLKECSSLLYRVPKKLNPNFKFEYLKTPEKKSDWSKKLKKHLKGDNPDSKITPKVVKSYVKEGNKKKPQPVPTSSESSNEFPPMEENGHTEWIKVKDANTLKVFDRVRGVCRNGNKKIGYNTVVLIKNCPAGLGGFEDIYLHFLVEEIKTEFKSFEVLRWKSNPVPTPSKAPKPSEPSKGITVVIPSEILGAVSSSLNVAKNSWWEDWNMSEKTFSECSNEDEALAKVKEYFGRLKKFKAFEEFCLYLESLSDR